MANGSAEERILNLIVSRLDAHTAEESRFQSEIRAELKALRKELADWERKVDGDIRELKVKLGVFVVGATALINGLALIVGNQIFA